MFARLQRLPKNSPSFSSFSTPSLTTSASSLTTLCCSRTFLPSSLFASSPNRCVGSLTAFFIGSRQSVYSTLQSSRLLVPPLLLPPPPCLKKNTAGSPGMLILTSPPEYSLIILWPWKVQVDQSQLLTSSSTPGLFVPNLLLPSESVLPDLNLAWALMLLRSTTPKAAARWFVLAAFCHICRGSPMLPSFFTGQLPMNRLE
mmetsp:Transcript_23402/g.44024  ORF Transcript_23402/g.44024 Transcript_23402/m.44024 type:complete len:201 (-) Transcript_23402:1414-2016(-)